MRIPAAALAGTVALAVAVGAMSLVGPDRPETPARTDARSNPVAAEEGELRNVAFYYDGTIDLATADPEAAREVLGSPGVVVTTRSDDEVGTVQGIHALGAKAYRYVQLYWMPEGQEYDGLDIAEHEDWAYCRRGSTPSVGRTTHRGTQDWVFLDANETEVRAYFSDLLADLRDQGWDGIFIDRGQAATQYAADEQGRPIWARPSTCTEDPAVPGATFADAYVGIVRLARATGLGTMVNNGKSPFDPSPSMRPDPGDKVGS